MSRLLGGCFFQSLLEWTLPDKSGNYCDPDHQCESPFSGDVKPFSFGSACLLTVRAMQQVTNQIMVWDPLIRFFHWLLVACFAIAYVVEDERIALHLLAGSIITGLIAFRLAWGFIGSRYSRFADFLFTPRQTFAHIRDLLRLRAGAHVGHNPAGSMMILALLAGLAALCLTGIALYGLQEGQGPMGGVTANASLDVAYLVETMHGLIADGLVILIMLHLGGVMLESLLQKQNLARAMFTGRKNMRILKPPKEIP